MAWKLLEQVDDYPDGEPFHSQPYQRVWGWEGQQWPKLVITVYGWPTAMTNDPVADEGVPLVGLKVCCSAQKSPEHWWHDGYPIPPELLGEVVGLLEEVRAGGVAELLEERL